MKVIDPGLLNRDGAIIGIAEHYAQFVKLCRARIEELGITYDTVDAISGFPARYTAKLMCGSKIMGIDAFFALAGALGLIPAFQHDPIALERAQRCADWLPRKKRKPMRAKKQALKIVFNLYPDLLRKRAVEGGRARALSLSPYQRKMIARRAAQIRWQNGADDGQ